MKTKVLRAIMQFIGNKAATLVGRAVVVAVAEHLGGEVILVMIDCES